MGSFSRSNRDQDDIERHFALDSFGLWSGLEPPFPRLAEQSAKRAIPNREVKRSSAHDTLRMQGKIGQGRGTQEQNKTN